MNRKAIADAANKISEGFMEFALAIEQSEAGASAPLAPAPTAPDADAAPVRQPRAPLPPRPQQQESAFTECPAHRQPFKEGRYGPFCSGQGEPDGNWFNDKGYCRVTPKSAGAWLKQHPQGAPAAPAQDTDDIPF